jgi:hypothetical protein
MTTIKTIASKTFNDPKERRKFFALVNKVARECDGDSGFWEIVSIARDFGAAEDVAKLVAYELGRIPS